MLLFAIKVTLIQHLGNIKEIGNVLVGFGCFGFNSVSGKSKALKLQINYILSFLLTIC